MTLADFPQLKRLPPRHRLKLAEQLWDSAASDSLAVSACHKRVVNSRRKAYEQGQIATLTMGELKKSIRRRKRAASRLSLYSSSARMCNSL